MRYKFELNDISLNIKDNSEWKKLGMCVYKSLKIFRKLYCKYKTIIQTFFENFKYLRLFVLESRHKNRINLAKNLDLRDDSRF